MASGFRCGVAAFWRLLGLALDHRAAIGPEQWRQPAGIPAGPPEIADARLDIAEHLERIHARLLAMESLEALVLLVLLRHGQILPPEAPSTWLSQNIVRGPRRASLGLPTDPPRSGTHRPRAAHQKRGRFSRIAVGSHKLRSKRESRRPEGGFRPPAHAGDSCDPGACSVSPQRSRQT